MGESGGRSPHPLGRTLGVFCADSSSTLTRNPRCRGRRRERFAGSRRRGPEPFCSPQNMRVKKSVI